MAENPYRPPKAWVARLSEEWAYSFGLSRAARGYFGQRSR
jgi:hypothetical protein